jgi:hypothetical protein
METGLTREDLRQAIQARHADTPARLEGPSPCVPS